MNRIIVFCSRCQGKFREKGQAARASCPYCGFAHIVRILTAGPGGTARTADSTGDATAATSITVT